MYYLLILGGQGCWHLRFRDVEIEAQGVYMIAPNHMTNTWASPDLNPGGLAHHLSSGLPHCAITLSGEGKADIRRN